MPKQEKTQVEIMSSEQLALLLNQQYAQLMQAQQNIAVINKELEKRTSANVINEATTDKKE